MQCGRASPEADARGFLSPNVSAEYEDALDLEHEVVTVPDETDLDTAGMGYTDTIRLPPSNPIPEGPPVQLNDPKVDNVQILDDFTRQHGDTIRLPKSSFGAPVPEEPVNLDETQILSIVTRRKPHYKNEHMEIRKGNAKPQYDFESFPQKKGDYDITIFPKNEEEYLVAGGKMTENERYLIDAFSAQSKQNKKQRKSLMEGKDPSDGRRKSRTCRPERDNARIWYADKVFSTKKTTKKRSNRHLLTATRGRRKRTRRGHRSHP